MMQATDAREGYQTYRQVLLRGNRPHRRCIFFQGVVRSARVIIREVVPNPAAQMSFADDDYVIQQFSTALGLTA